MGSSFLTTGEFHALYVPQLHAEMKHYVEQEPLHHINQDKEALTKLFLYSFLTAPLLTE